MLILLYACLFVLACANAQFTTETVDCLYFHVSPVLAFEIKHYYAPKHYYVMREKLRRLSISKGIPEATIHKCIWNKYRKIID